ncbi:MAG: hypothetical protein N2039_10420 [Gemmataceae bacterium]|nr:hypothetical protein [Gemmataceae bacterium]
MSSNIGHPNETYSRDSGGKRDAQEDCLALSSPGLNDLQAGAGVP